MPEQKQPRKPTKRGSVGRPRKAVPGELVIDKREQILQGALVAFLEHGYAGTSVDKVAEEGGVSKQTIYSYFKNKEELFAALIDKMLALITGGALPPQLLSMDAGTMLRKVGALMLERQGSWEFVSFLRLLIGESGRFPELTDRYVKKVIQPGQQLLSLCFGSILDLPDPEAAAWIFNGCLIAYIIRQEVLQAKHTMVMPRERLVNAVADILLYASAHHKATK